jgi:hypothetical protein
MGNNQQRFWFLGSGLNTFLSWLETGTHYVLRHVSGFQFLHIPKWAFRDGKLLYGDVRWNASEQLFEWQLM